MGMAEDLKEEHGSIVQAREAAGAIARRYYDAASRGRRTEGWRRSSGDSASTTSGQISVLRDVARDLVRNNAWARSALRTISNNTVGWGITPRGLMPDAAGVWSAWANSNTCDARGILTLSGLQRAVIECVAVSGECLVVRHIDSGGAHPLRLEVLEPDHIDTAKDSLSLGAARTTQGIEFDERGKPAAYWLYPDHPGSSAAMRRSSVRVPAEQVIHIFRVDRPGQVRGVSWFAPAAVKLHDFDDYHDALLVRQKLAACFSAFVTELDGASSALGEESDDGLLETFEPGRIDYLKPGQSITFANPPGVPESEGKFATLCLRSIAAAMSVTYEDLTGDYSQVNYSSARMGRIAHWGSVADWQYNMLIPQFCDRVFSWWRELAPLVGVSDPGVPEWTPPPMQMTDPEKEGKAYLTLIRAGAMTHNELAAAMGRDPRAHWRDYADGLAQLDALGIVLDSDARKTTAQGISQIEPAESSPSDAIDKESNE